MPATPIGPGTPLICIDASTDGHGKPWVSGRSITQGALYICDAIFPVRGNGRCRHCGNTVETTIVLRGKPLSRKGNGYCPSRFKPLNDGDTSLVANETGVDDRTPVNA